MVQIDLATISKGCNEIEGGEVLFDVLALEIGRGSPAKHQRAKIGKCTLFFWHMNHLIYAENHQLGGDEGGSSTSIARTFYSGLSDRRDRKSIEDRRDSTG